MQYKDIDLTMATHPVTRDVSIRKDKSAVQQSIKTLVLTSYEELKGSLAVGGNVDSMLFAMQTPLTATQIQQEIEQVISNYEPRVELSSVVVKEVDEYGYDIFISYYDANTAEKQEIKMPLKRYR